MTLSSIDGASSVEEAQLRDEETTLLLTLHGPALWSASARSGGLTGLRLSLQPAASLKLLRVAAPEPRQLVLTLERHPTFDVPHDVPLTLHVTHTCAGSMLQTTALACTDAPVADAPVANSDSSLGASLLVRSGGLPPSKPGRPQLQHLNSYGSLRVVWAPPEVEGDSPVSHYAWVEYVGGVPVLTGDAVPRHDHRERRLGSATACLLGLLGLALQAPWLRHALATRQLRRSEWVGPMGGCATAKALLCGWAPSWRAAPPGTRLCSANV